MQKTPTNVNSKKEVIIFGGLSAVLSAGFALWITRNQNKNIQNMLDKKMLHETMSQEKMLQSIRAMIREEQAYPIGENTDIEDNADDDNEDKNDYSKKNRKNMSSNPIFRSNKLF